MASKPGAQYYRENENVGTETRNREFKNGPGFIQHDFRQNVAKYACSFVNSRENGTLMIGVKDSGIVRGYHANHNEEDYIRKEIDNAIKDIHPELFPSDYTVDFVPVWNEAGRQQIQIYVRGADISVETGRLYEARQGAFIRRDGSVQGPLSSQMILEWTRRQYQTEIDKHKKNEDNLRSELSTKQRDYSNIDRQLKQKEEEIARREQAIIYSVQNQNEQMQAEKNELKMSNVVMQQEIGEIKELLSTQRQKKSKVCTIL